MTGYLRLFISGIAGVLFLALAPNAALAEKRVALIVGNSAYRNVARLPNPERDAASIAGLFRDNGFDTVVAENNIGNLDFKRAIRKFEDAAADSDIAVVFYAGHGIEIGGVNYLVPSMQNSPATATLRTKRLRSTALSIRWRVQSGCISSFSTPAGTILSSPP